MDVVKDAPEHAADVDPGLALRIRHAAAVRTGVSWMLAIGFLSLVNTGAAIALIPARMVVGLTFTQVLMAVLWNQGIALSATGLLLSCAIAGGLIALAWAFRKRGVRSAALTVIVIYILDLALTVFLQDWLGAGFHVLALYFVVRGYQAFGALAGPGGARTHPGPEAQTAAAVTPESVAGFAPINPELGPIPRNRVPIYAALVGGSLLALIIVVLWLGTGLE